MARVSPPFNNRVISVTRFLADTEAKPFLDPLTSIIKVNTTADPPLVILKLKLHVIANTIMNTSSYASMITEITYLKTDTRAKPFQESLTTIVTVTIIAEPPEVMKKLMPHVTANSIINTSSHARMISETTDMIETTNMIEATDMIAATILETGSVKSSPNSRAAIGHFLIKEDNTI